ncbi:uncharacterized protein C8A04DRAFT_31251 [Dichotomopilus funicola]|uniref:Uncharacterized protein n=1 Tax=Dichotomopilus funicola TaxID=1934379 RepID=A0AAN6UY91_9PEZI|nr:hypothetical protein C8A04DRAFT_31251 [Dichotomopilus funicola]
MVRNLHPRNNPNARVSSWLRRIPDDLESEGDETLVSPSVYDQSYPRLQKDEPRFAKLDWESEGGKEDPEEDRPYQQPQARATVPTKKSIPAHPKLVPKEVFQTTTLKPAPRSPTRTQPPQPGATRPEATPQPQPPLFKPQPPPNQTPKPPLPLPEPTALPSPQKDTTTTPLPIRTQILTNFALHCPLCHPPLPRPLPHTPSSTDTCARCAAARSYVSRTHHSPAFLAGHLLPISDVLSFEEVVAYLNQAVVGRLAREEGMGMGGGKGMGNGGKRLRTWPVLDDYDVVREMAVVRGRVVGGFGLGVDRFGMLRDRLRD